MANRILKVEIVGDSRRFTGALRSAEGGVSRFGSRLRTFASGAVALGAGVFATGKIIDWGKSLNAAGVRLDVMGRKAQTVFGSATDAVKHWADSVNEDFGLTDDVLVGLTANFGDLLKPMGFTEQQAAMMSAEVVNLSGALSAWSGGQTSAAEVSEILSKAMLGEREQLKSLGISITEADVKARLAAKGQAELTGAALQQAKAVATQELIFEKSTDAQAAWADGSLDAIKNQNRLTAGFAEMKEELALRLQPAFASLTRFMLDKGLPAMTSLMDMVGDLLPRAIAGLQKAWDRFGVPIVQAVGDVIDWFRDNWDTITDVASDVWSAVETAGRLTWDALKSGGQEVLDAFSTVSADAVALWQQYGPTVGPALEAAGEAIIDTIGDVWPEIQRYAEGQLGMLQGAYNVGMGLLTGDWRRAWEGVKQIGRGFWDALNGMYRGGWAGIRGATEAALNIWKGQWDAGLQGIVQLLGEDFVNRSIHALNNLPAVLSGLAQNALRTMREGFELGWGWIDSFFSGIPGRIVAAIGDIGKTMWDLGSSAAGSFAAGFNNTIGQFVPALPTFGGSATIDRIVGQLEGRASGGPVSAYKPYVIGERGPELFVPGASGTIIPNHALGGGGGGTQTINLVVDGRVLASTLVRNERRNGPGG